MMFLIDIIKVYHSNVIKYENCLYITVHMVEVLSTRDHKSSWTDQNLKTHGMSLSKSTDAFLGYTSVKEIET